jgi:hypothetical protein
MKRFIGMLLAVGMAICSFILIVYVDIIDNAGTGENTKEEDCDCCRSTFDRCYVYANDFADPSNL